jgi:uncharacterized protein YodC (DUF2158 family)
MFKVGDTVRLKSGGPVMTVSTAADADSDVLCKWFDGKKLLDGIFPDAALEKAKADSGLSLA